tara:strand:- start:115 stop:885 length:771 start_codon:yes stop_codon:yes gene_type:complete
MNTVNYKMVTAVIFIMFLATACSKKLMPPEIGSSSEGLESTDFTASNPPQDQNTLGGSGDFGNSGFSEEPILESGASVGSGSGGMAGNSAGSSGGSSPNNFGSSGKANIGNGSSGSFGANPFVDNGSKGSGAGNQTAKLNSTFHETKDLQDIHFKFDKYDLDNDSRKVLQQNAELLKKNPSMKIEIQGHCDERGTNNYNTALGERRANSTKKFLVSLGVDASRLNTISYGEEKPFCFDSNESCWFKNRRAHFMIAK